MKNTSQKQVLLNSVLDYIHASEWEYSRYGEGNDILEISMNVGGAMGHCRLMILCNEADVQVYAVAPINAPAENFAHVVEFLTRANTQLRIGAFEFDYDTGEIRYHACLLCSEGAPSLNDIIIVTGIPVVMMQHYGEGIMKNALGHGDPARDIAELG